MSNQEIIAVVAGEEVTNADFEAFLKSVPQEQRAYAMNPQFRDTFKEQFLSMFLYAKLGEEMKLDESETFKKAMANARRDMLAQLAINEVLKDVVPEEEEMKTFYEANVQHFQKNETVSAKHILVKEEEKCNEVLAEINNGKTFEEAAQEYSTCPSGQKGGDLGEFGKGQMVKEFEEVAFTAEIGTVAGPVKTQFGYHLIKVEKRNEASTMPYEEVKDRIHQMILQQKQNRVFAAKAEELKAKYVEK